jgi:hypothetical protein
LTAATPSSTQFVPFIILWCTTDFAGSQAEHRRPKLKQFANHWAVEFLAKESFNNLFNYQHKKANRRSTTTSSRSKKTTSDSERDSHTTSSLDNMQDDDTMKENARKAAVRRAVALRAAERKAAKRKAADLLDEDSGPCNDGETETEDIPDHLHKRIEREEIGVPGRYIISSRLSVLTILLPVMPRAPVKMATKLKSPSASKEPGSQTTSTANTPAPKTKTRPVIYLKRGRGGLAGGRGSAHHDRGHHDRGSAPVGQPLGDGNGDVPSNSSGQTSSGDD